MYLLKEKVIPVLGTIESKRKSYIHDKYENIGEVNIDDIAENAFHFTSMKNNPGISGEGLIPIIGANSKDEFGKEAISKVFFARGIKGTMQIFNRLVILGYEVPLNALKSKTDRARYLLDMQKKEDDDRENLSILEAFEYARKSMEESNYFTFEIHDTEYDKKLNEEILQQQIENINTHLDSIKGIQITATFNEKEKKILDRIIESIKEQRIAKNKNIEKMLAAQEFFKCDNGETIILNNPKLTAEGIDECIDELLKENENALSKKLNRIRKQITIAVRRESKTVVNNLIRGKIIPESCIGANAERIDYNEDKMEWIDTKRYPHNCHTMVVDFDDDIEEITAPRGIGIGKEKLQLLSIDGKKPASTVDIVKEFYEHATPEERKKFSLTMPNGQKDRMMIGDFLEYVDIYERCNRDPEILRDELEKLQESILERYPDSKTIQSRMCDKEIMKRFVAELHTIAVKKDREDKEGFEL